MDRDDKRNLTSTPAQPSHSERSSHVGARSDEIVPVRLVRKYADMIDGVNLQDATVGDRLEVSRRDADILIAEGWAVPAGLERRVLNLPRRADEERRGRSLARRALAADSSPTSRRKPKP
jgi:hypothetical protein